MGKATWSVMKIPPCSKRSSLPDLCVNLAGAASSASRSTATFPPSFDPLSGLTAIVLGAAAARCLSATHRISGRFPMFDIRKPCRFAEFHPAGGKTPTHRLDRSRKRATNAVFRQPHARPPPIARHCHAVCSPAGSASKIPSRHSPSPAQPQTFQNP